MGIQSISKTDLTSLAETNHGPCVSIFLDAPEAGEETRESPKRLRVLLREAKSRMESADVDKRQVAALLEPCEALLEDYPFWQHQYGGVAIFSAKDTFRIHQTDYALGEQVVLGNRFHVKPLLPMWYREGTFLLLALSRNEVRLYRATRHALTEVELEDVPRSQAEALRFDDPEKSLQVHAGEPGSKGEQTGITHGHGAAREEVKERTLRFFKKLDRALQPHLAKESAPLLLAGVEYYLPLYREANTYPHLVEDVLAGNPEEVPEEELHQSAWAKMKSRMKQPMETARAAIEQGMAKGKATADLAEAVVSACQGRAEICFVNVRESRWGRYDENRGRVQTLDKADPDAVDLVDLAAVMTLSQGGEVFPVSATETMPDGQPVAVLHRY